MSQGPQAPAPPHTYHSTDEEGSRVCSEEEEARWMVMGRAMTLRGGFDMLIGRNTAYGGSTEKRLFAYESMDRTRGWRVTYASVWIQELIHGTGGGDSRALAQWTLSTDTLGAVIISTAATAREWERRMGPSDNRTIAWGTADYQTRENTNADFLVANRIDSPMRLDVDRLVTNELWVQAFGVTEGGADLTLQCGYLIELEEVKITPSESVLQQLKGIGQDVGA